MSKITDAREKLYAAWKTHGLTDSAYSALVSLADAINSLPEVCGTCRHFSSGATRCQITKKPSAKIDTCDCSSWSLAEWLGGRDGD